jgi:hypothetical protein
MITFQTTRRADAKLSQPDAVEISKIQFMPRNSLLCALLKTSVLASCVILAAYAFAHAVPAFGANETGRIHWKPVPVAQVKLDDKPPLSFNVYQPDKKKDSHLVLILLGHRYLELDIKAKLVYVVLLSDLQKKGDDFETDNLAVPVRLLPSGDWSERDVGPAELIKLTLKDYGRVLEILLPHPPDMRAFY